MPPKQSRKRAASNDYEADGGFVEDAPKNKKTKASAGEAKAGAKTSDNGNEFWELGRTRRVQLNEFKGKQLVDIREYYEKDEQMLPGKKGISLNIDQLTSFIEQLPELEAALKKKGIDIPRPAYDGKVADIDQDDEVEAKASANDSEDEENMKSKAARLDKFKHKANHEATSDEDN